MAPRLELDALLRDILGSDRVYFQPPEDVKLVYPCIVYQREFVQLDHADDRTYNQRKRYQVTVIDTDPDSTIHEEILELPKCRYERFYTADQLNHDVLILFY